MTPRAGRDSVEGVGPAGELLLRVRAAPADGAANKAALKTVAAALDVAPSRLKLVSGATGRTKRVALDGGEQSALKALWPALLTREE